jgi:hypothetical protein
MMRGILNHPRRRRTNYQLRRWVFVAIVLLALIGYLTH